MAMLWDNEVLLLWLHHSFIAQFWKNKNVIFRILEVFSLCQKKSISCRALLQINTTTLEVLFSSELEIWA